MTPMDDQELKRLKDLAGKATSGPWENSRGFVRSTAAGNSYSSGKITIQTSCQWVAECRDGEAFYNPDGNAGFIAACDPQTIISLIEEVLRSRQSLSGERVS